MKLESPSRRTSLIVKAAVLFACLLPIATPISAQDLAEYPEPFMGGYLSMNHDLVRENTAPNAARTLGAPRPKRG